MRSSVGIAMLVAATAVVGPSLTSKEYEGQGARELERQSALARVHRPQRDTARAFGPKPLRAKAGGAPPDRTRRSPAVEWPVSRPSSESPRGAPVRRGLSPRPFARPLALALNERDSARSRCTRVAGGMRRAGQAAGV